jgi:hypothetical protein
LECASGYNIHVSDATAAGGSNLQALATPKTKTCSKEDGTGGIVVRILKGNSMVYLTWELLQDCSVWHYTSYSNFSRVVVFFNGQAATQNDAKDINLKVLCSPVPLTCAKPFTEFPNACTGVLPLVSGKAKSLPGGKQHICESCTGCVSARDP